VPIPSPGMAAILYVFIDGLRDKSCVFMSGRRRPRASLHRERNGAIRTTVLLLNPTVTKTVHLQLPRSEEGCVSLWRRSSRQVHGEAFEITERAVSQSALVRRTQDDAGCLVGLECFLPARCA